MLLKRVQNFTNFTPFGKIQTSTMTFTALFNTFPRNLRIHSKISSECPHANGDSSQYPYPYPWTSHRNFHIHVGPAKTGMTKLSYLLVMS